MNKFREHYNALKVIGLENCVLSEVANVVINESFDLHMSHRIFFLEYLICQKEYNLYGLFLLPQTYLLAGILVKILHLRFFVKR